MDSGQMDVAKLHAETVIRNKKEALNVQRFGLKMSALAQKMESAARTQEMSQQMASAVPALSKAMKQMDSMGVSKIIICVCFNLNFYFVDWCKYCKL